MKSVLWTVQSNFNTDRDCFRKMRRGSQQLYLCKILANQNLNQPKPDNILNDVMLFFIKKVSYSKAIDYFLMTSLGFIFMSLLEYILVLNTDPRFWTERRREEKFEKMKSLYKVRDAFNTLVYMCSSNLLLKM